MSSAILPRWPVLVVVAALVLWSSAADLSNAVELTHNSPQVKSAVADGLKYLHAHSNHNDPGGKALIGLAMLKGGVSRQDSVVQSLGADVRQATSRTSDKLPFDQFYTPAIMTLFLVELDPQRYSHEINTMLQYILSLQKPCGGWGYSTRSTGDTSMTQYGVLAFWELKRAGFHVPLHASESVCLWLLKTQDPSGGFGYQGKVSNDFTPVAQVNVRPSLTAAGAGSVYACADLLGFVNRRKDDGLPVAMREIIKDEKPIVKTRSSINPTLIRTVQSRGDQWLQQHYTVDPPNWPRYYLYALERYWSFRELSEGGRRPNHPNWYHDAATFLLAEQEDDGSWKGRGPKPVSTAFCVLFLVRASQQSTQKSKDLGAGTLIGGRGLPKDTDLVRVRAGRVVGKIEVGSIQKMLTEAIDADDAKYGEAINATAELSPDEVKVLISQQEARLHKLAGGSSADQRLAAVSALARAGQLDDVPILIYALTDPEPEIVDAACSGLRRISRKFDGFGLPTDPKPVELRAAIRKWKDWYLAVRPDAEFEN